MDVGHGAGHGLALADPHDAGGLVDEGGLHLGEHGIGVGGDQDLRHGGGG